MTELHPSIINAMRRRELDKNPERNIIPAQRLPERKPNEPVIEEPRTLGRIAMLAQGVRLVTRSQRTGESGDSI